VWQERKKKLVSARWRKKKGIRPVRGRKGKIPVWVSSKKGARGRQKEIERRALRKFRPKKGIS